MMEEEEVRLTEMSTFTSPTSSPEVFPAEKLTIIVASFSCLVFFLVIVVLLSIIFRKDPLCCKVWTYQDSHIDLEAPCHFYSSRQTLVASPCAELPSNTRLDNPNTPSGQLFYVGLPSAYRLPSLEPPLPRLPSYESVRKKDRQRQIHMMIADRFGLNGPMTDTELPPTYEESVQQSIQSLEDPFEATFEPAFEATSSPSPQAQDTNAPPEDALPPYEALPPNTSSPATTNTPHLD